jgi:hypothetical protein
VSRSPVCGSFACVVARTTDAFLYITAIFDDSTSQSEKSSWMMQSDPEILNTKCPSNSNSVLEACVTFGRISVRVNNINIINSYAELGYSVLQFFVETHTKSLTSKSGSPVLVSLAFY